MKSLRISLCVALCAALLGLGPLAAPGKPKPPPPPADPAIVCTSNSDLMLMDADGANATTLLRGIGGVGYTQCSWAADGCRIVFTSNMNRTNGMYYINKDGSDLHFITPVNSTGGSSSPAWSNPNDETGTEWIAFSDFDLVNYHNLFLVLPDGSNLVQLSEPGQTEWYPSWAPDGQRLAVQTFYQPPDNGYSYTNLLIYELSFAGDPITGYTVTVLSKTNLTEGTILSGMILYSDWAHHGDSLVVVTRRNCAGDIGGYGNIYRIDLVPDGPPVFTCILDRTVQLVGSSLLSWSEDDQWIVFVGSRRDSKGNIIEHGMYKMPADGSGVPQLIKSEGKTFISMPDWRPVRCGQ